MRRVIAIGALLCGCGANSALEIVVEMNPQIAVDRVQLYVGLGDPQNESGKPELLVPRDYTYPAAPQGYYYKRDPFGASDVLDVDPDATDVRFVFREGTHDRVTAIVIGENAGKIVAAASLVDATLEDGSVRQYHVRLAPASPAVPRPAAAPVTVHRWGPKPDDTSCAFLETAADPAHSIYIVDKNDRDCDGLVESDTANLECRPDVFLGRIRPPRELTSCLRADDVPAPAQVTTCVLGGPGCADGQGRGPCEPSTVCATPATCVACAQRPDPLDCAANLPLVTAGTTRLDCTFFVRIGEGLCPGAAVVAPKPTYLPACNADEDVWFWAPDQDQWRQKTFTRGGLTFTANRPTSACDLALAASGEPANPQAPITALATVALANGRGAALPVHITFVETADCANLKNQCAPEGEAATAAFVSCLQAPVVEPW